MSELIQWPRAKYWTRAWNPVVGCRAVSPACEHCWAREWMGRFPQYGGSFEPRETKAGGPPRTGVVFCGNMTDLFGEWCNRLQFAVPEAFVAMTLGRPKATFLWLTKRPAVMADTLRNGIAHMVDGGFERFEGCEMENQWFGVTAENKSWWQRRLFDVVDFPSWANWWVSAEPLLGPLFLGLPYMPPAERPGWVVVGCESGRNRRPCRVEWVESIVEECMDAGVPVFVKQLDLGGRVVTDIERFPEPLRVRQVPWAGRQGEKG